MSLNTDAEERKKTRNRKGKQRQLEQTAQKFAGLVDARKGREALEYYNCLDADGQEYIRQTERYAIRLKAASFCGV